VAGLKASEDIESSGGEVTSKSFIGLADDVVVVAPKLEDAPSVLWLNIMTYTRNAPEILQCACSSSEQF
jgi:hypothetical protein